jgi:ubiquinone/menaquinone biosynthesis C-methylase UbiE
MTNEEPRPAIRPNDIKKWIRTKFLSPYLYKIPKEEKTLDLACGWGFSFNINPDFYGVELNDECVSFCQQQGFKVKKGNLVEPLPFPDNFFDNCFTHDVLEHFELSDVDSIFQNVYRVLKPGGLFMNITPNKRGYDYGLIIDVGHKHYIIPTEIKEIAERSGFEYVDSYSVPVPEFLNRWFVHGKYLTTCRKL